MDVTIAGDAITYRPSDDNLGGLSLEFAAFDGEVGTGQAPVPDLAAAIDYYDGRQFKVSEGATLLTDGFIIDQDRERGTTPTDPARLHTFSVMDANALLDGFRVERSRPAETDVERVLAFAALDGPDWDTTWVLDENTVTMPAKKYASDGGWTSELIPDTIEFTGKTTFLHDKAGGDGGDTGVLSFPGDDGSPDYIMDGNYVSDPFELPVGGTITVTVSGIDAGADVYVVDTNGDFFGSLGTGPGTYPWTNLTADATDWRIEIYKTGSYDGGMTGSGSWVTSFTLPTGRCLHYHVLTSGHTCGLSISDQTSNGPTIWNPWEPRRQRTSVDLRNDIKAIDNTGRTSTVTDATSISLHDADGLRHQSLVNIEADSQGDLDIKAAALLASEKDERDTFTCSIGPLDEAALALIRVGDLITVTSSVMGLEADVQRIAHMTLHPWIGEGGRVVEGYWLAELEMGAPVRRRARVANKATTDRIRHTPIVSEGGGDCVATYWALLDHFNRTVPPSDWDTSSSGAAWTITSAINAAVQFSVGGTGVIDVTPALSSDTGEVQLDIPVATITPVPGTGVIGLKWIWTVSDDANASVRLHSSSRMLLRLDSNTAADEFLFSFSDSGNTLRTVVIDAHLVAGTYDLEMTRDYDAGTITVKVDGTTVLSYSTAFTFSATDPVTVFVGTAPLSPYTVPFTIEIDNLYVRACQSIAAYHWTTYGPIAPQEAPDGVTVTFTLPDYPGGGYIPGTLVAWVDGVRQVVTETDPAAGTFTFSWAPTSDEEIRIMWLVP